MSTKTIAQVRRILDIHCTSQGIIRPHFFLTGPSGSGKTYNVEGLCDELMMPMYEINCAQLTKEGLSGNSLSKALAPIANSAMSPCVVFFDEFDKLFIRGNSNSDLADDSTTSIQNELLKILEGRTTSVYTGKYGQYEEITINHCLFIFGGAWNGEADIDLDRLRAFGVKTELLGRVGLVYSMEKVQLDALLKAVETSELLDNYLKIYTDVVREDVVTMVQDVVRENYELNTLGYRQIAALLHQYFINGTLKSEKKQPVFKKALTLPKADNLFADA
jgi:ATP-dependent protease Clp ATPase subunit